MNEVLSVLLYGAEVRAHALDKKVYRKRLSRVQRRGAFKISSAYRTVSESAVLVIARIIPVDLQPRNEELSIQMTRGRQGDREPGREILHCR